MDIEKQDVKNGLINKIIEGVPNASIQEIEAWVEKNKTSIVKMSESVIIGVAIKQLQNSIKLADMDTIQAYYLGAVDDWAQFNKTNTHHLFLKEDGNLWESTLFGSKPKGVVTELRPFYKYALKLSTQESQKGNSYSVIENYTELKETLLDFDSLQETDLEKLPNLNKKNYPIVLKGSFYQVNPFERSMYDSKSGEWDKDPNLFPGLYEGQILFQSKLFKKRFYIDIICSYQKTGKRIFIPLGEDIESIKFILESNPTNEQEYKRLNPSFDGKYDTIQNNELIERQVKALNEGLSGFDFKAVGWAYINESQSYQTRDDWSGNIVNVKFTPSIMKLIPKTSYTQEKTVVVTNNNGSLEGFEQFYKTLIMTGPNNIYPAIQPLKETGLFEQLRTNGMVIVSGEKQDHWEFLSTWDSARHVFENFWKIKTAQEKELTSQSLKKSIDSDLTNKIQTKVTEIKTALPTIDNKSLAEAVSKQFNIPAEQILQMLTLNTPKLERDGKELDSKKDSDLYKEVEKLLHTMDSGNGIEFSALVGDILKTYPQVQESVVDDILFEMAYEGKVYQPRPDYYKIM